MTTILQNIPANSVLSKWALIWLAVVAALVALLTILTVSVSDNPSISQDLRVMKWIVDWDLPGLTTYFNLVSAVTHTTAGIVYGVLGVTFLILLGKTRPAIAFLAVGLSIAVVALAADHSLGVIVDRGRPLDPSHLAFPSGHTYGTTVFFTFIGFSAVYYRMKPKILIPMLGIFALLIVSVGLGRIHLQAHFPSDVAGGYLLAAISLLIIIPALLWIRSTGWMASRKLDENLGIVACESCMVASSIASVVVLGPVEGTATKVYPPPPLVRILYWIAFQVKFPYESNTAALASEEYRRQIASLLTTHLFGKDLVAPVTMIDCSHGNCSFVTKFIPGELAQNDEPAQKFMGEVSELFAEAGLSVWQVNPRNPHAHTNLIRNVDGYSIIIDLESAVVSLFPAPGQFMSSLKTGNPPIFDDIDFPRLKNYTDINEAALVNTIGTKGVAALRHATEHAEEAINAWKAAEPRIISHLISGTYRLLNFKARFQHIMGALTGADAVAELFLNNGIDRCEKQDRINHTEAEGLCTRPTSGAARYATRHLGAHLVLSVAIAVPTPGVRSAARFLCTFSFRIRVQIRRLLRRNVADAYGMSNIHTPLVMPLSLLPGLGGVAYLA